MFKKIPLKKKKEISLIDCTCYNFNSVYTFSNNVMEIYFVGIQDCPETAYMASRNGRNFETAQKISLKCILNNSFVFKVG